MREPKTMEAALSPEKSSLLSREFAGVIGIIAFAFLTAVGALIRVPLPFTPVPVTMQVFFVLLCGAVLGPSRGAASQVLYICLGAAGLPVFTAGAGAALLLGPTGGYIIGFVVAQAVIGLIVTWPGGMTTNMYRISAAMLSGIIVIYTFGAAQLMIFTGADVAAAVTLGILPFIPFDIAKAVLAAAAAAAFRRYVSRGM